MTIAEIISNLFNNNGQLWENESGLELYTICQEKGYSEKNVSYHNESTGKEDFYNEVFFFEDGSCIIIIEGSWDIA